jgi:hypothetical protein
MKILLFVLCIVYVYSVRLCNGTSTVLSTISNFEVIANSISNSGTTIINGDSASTSAPTGGGTYTVTGTTTIGGTTVS